MLRTSLLLALLLARCGFYIAVAMSSVTAIIGVSAGTLGGGSGRAPRIFSTPPVLAQSLVTALGAKVSIFNGDLFSLFPARN